MTLLYDLSYIDEIGEFKTIPLFTNADTLKHKLNPRLAQIFKQNTVSFKPSDKLLALDIA